MKVVLDDSLENTLLKIDGVEIGQPAHPGSEQKVFYRGAGCVGIIDATGHLVLRRPEILTAYESFLKAVAAERVGYRSDVESRS